MLSVKTRCLTMDLNEDETAQRRERSLGLLEDAARNRKTARERRQLHLSWLRQQRNVFSVSSFPDKLAALEALVADVERYTQTEREERCKELGGLMVDVAKLRTEGWLTDEEAGEERKQLEQHWQELDSAQAQYEETLRSLLLACHDKQAEPVEREMERKHKASSLKVEHKKHDLTQPGEVEQILQERVEQLCSWCARKAGSFKDTRQEFAHHLSALEELVDCFDEDYLRKEYAHWQSTKVDLDTQLSARATTNSLMRDLHHRLTTSWQDLKMAQSVYRVALDRAIEERQAEAADEAEASQLLSWAWQQRAEVSRQRSAMLDYDVQVLQNMLKESQQRANSEETAKMRRKKTELVERLGGRQTSLARASVENIRSAFWSLEKANEAFVKAVQVQIRQKERHSKGTHMRAAAVLEWVKQKRSWLKTKDVAKMNRAELEQLTDEFCIFQQQEWVEQRLEKRTILGLLLREEQSVDGAVSPQQGSAPPSAEDSSLAEHLQSAWSEIRREVASFAQELEAAMPSSVEETELPSKSLPPLKQFRIELPAAVQTAEMQPLEEALPITDLEPEQWTGANLKHLSPISSRTQQEQTQEEILKQEAKEEESKAGRAAREEETTKPITVLSAPLATAKVQTSSRTTPPTRNTKKIGEDNTTSSDSSIGEVEIDEPLISCLSARDCVQEHMESQAIMVAWIGRQTKALQKRDFPRILQALEQLRQDVGFFERGVMASKLLVRNALIEEGRMLVGQLGEEIGEGKAIVDGNAAIISAWESMEQEKCAYKEALRATLQERVVPTPPTSPPQGSSSYKKMLIRHRSSSSTRRPVVLHGRLSHDTTINTVTLKQLISSLWFNYNDVLVPF